jgi:hypothetical protein
MRFPKLPFFGPALESGNWFKLFHGLAAPSNVPQYEGARSQRLAESRALA